MSLFNLLKFIIFHPINRDQKLNSLKRFIQWQISSRLALGTIAFDWIHGSKFFVRNGETGLTGNIYAGLHEFPDMGYLLHTLQANDKFVDIGANAGSYTILASSVIGANSYSFEPSPNAYSRLVENIRLNKIENQVKAFNFALGESEGVIRFTNNLDTINHAIATNERINDVLEVKVTTLDLTLCDISPEIIKIDVEGYETKVLEGSMKTLLKKNLHTVIMELNGSGTRYGFNESAILSMMLDIGFNTFAYNPLTRELKSLYGKSQKTGNTIFIRNEALVRGLLTNAPKINVFGKLI